MGFKSPLTLLGISIPGVIKGFRNILPWWLGGKPADIIEEEDLGGPSDGYLAQALREDEEFLMMIMVWLKH